MSILLHSEIEKILNLGSAAVFPLFFINKLVFMLF